jgi:hypothetical protein
MIMSDEKREELRRALKDTKIQEEEARQQRILNEKAKFQTQLNAEVNEKDMVTWKDKKEQLEASTDALWDDLEKRATTLIDEGVQGFDQYHTALNKVFRMQYQLCLALNASEKEWLHNKLVPGGPAEARPESAKKSAAMDAYRQFTETAKMPFSAAERDALKQVDYAELMRVDANGGLTFDFSDDDEYMAYVNDPKRMEDGDTRTADECVAAANGIFRSSTDVLLADKGYFFDENAGGYRNTHTGDALEDEDLVDVFAGDKKDQFNNFFREDVHASLEAAPPRVDMAYR